MAGLRYHLNSTYATSDEAIVAIVKHDVHEIESLRPLFKERPLLPFEDVHAMVNPEGSLHMEAWDEADELIEAIRSGVKE